MAKKPHYAGSYHVDSRRVRDAAYADPSTRCWRCRKRLHECGPRGDGRHANGKTAHWTAGHVNDGEVGGALLPECSPCAASSGARYGNRLRGLRRRARKAQDDTQQPTSEPW